MTRTCITVVLATGMLLTAQRGYGACSGDDGQTSTCIDADTVWPAWGHSRLAILPGTTIAPPKQVGVGLVTTYFSGPITLIVPTASPTPIEVSAVDQLVDATILGWVGLGSGFEVGAAVPLTLYRDGTGISTLTSERSQALPGMGLRDLRVGATYALVDHAELGRAGQFSLAARFELSLPTGHHGAFATNGGLVAIPTIISSVQLGRVFFQGLVGARVRTTQNLLGTRVGSQAWLGLGGGFSFDELDRYQLGIEAFVLPTLASQRLSEAGDIPGASPRGEVPRGASLIPSEWLASFRAAPFETREISISIGGGGPIELSDQKTTLPSARLMLGLRYTPGVPTERERHVIEPPPGVSY